MANTIKDSIKTRKIAVLAADGADHASLSAMKKALQVAGAVVHVIAPKLGAVQTNTVPVQADQSLLTAASVLYDAVYVAGGQKSAAGLLDEPDAIHFINEAYRHCKAIACDSSAAPVLSASYFAKRAEDKMADKGLLIGTGKKLVTDFMNAVAKHRFWERETARKVPV